MKSAAIANMPVLDNIRVASPCEMSWDDMRGDDRQRFCDHCRLNVYNLSNMTREEAEQLVFKREGRTCVRFFKRTDGTVITRDCPAGLAAVRARLVRLAAGSVAIFLGLLLGGLTGRVFGQGGPLHEHPTVVRVLVWLGIREEPSVPLMGDICVPMNPATPAGS
jgi:hypothetical protein